MTEKKYTRKEVQQILEMQRGLAFPRKSAPEIPADAHEHRVDFMQVVGDVIPLCWIPVADVQMIVKLLHQHMPEPTLRASRAQFQGVIDALNTYVGEALERNAKANAVGTWTAPDQEKKGKK